MLWLPHARTSHSFSHLHRVFGLPPAQVSRLSAQGARLCQFSEDCALAEVEARRVAAEQGATYISPYNDWEVSDASSPCARRTRGPRGGYPSLAPVHPPAWFLPLELELVGPSAPICDEMQSSNDNNSTVSLDLPLQASAQMSGD